MERIIVSFEFGNFGSASVKYTVTTDEGPEDFSVKCYRFAHPDLTDIFTYGLRDWAGYLLGFPEECREEIVRPSGVEFIGDDYIRLIVMVKGPEEIYKVKLRKTKIPSEHREKLDALKAEILAYLDGKSSQLSLFGETSENELTL